MNTIEWITLSGVAVTALAGAGGHLVKRGRQEHIEGLADRVKALEDVGADGKLSALITRVTSLEGDMSKLVAGLQKLEVSNAKVETKLEGIVEQLKDLNASLRWAREAAPHDPPAR
jgi:hypothetical protein